MKKDECYLVINVMDLRKSFVCKNKSSVSRLVGVSRNNIQVDKIVKGGFMIIKTNIN